ncbi:uncharacterized protein L969DRAFT_43987 [Mixia osmundae IAM 14324]|uniref:Uncharacterized protein n=1 Tax=Mixia osmundae (strain CBS 9802 / IAM 14324 / JCM 22182 / KY 12970) TaxID=764103 RepID=G7DSS7_MIXOS|nr:uncharacterized protein L969DRAFT_43987 [Mixia osmundae IAM 14324]KEI41819.1 hypothetical protein L969DRAFT_43987 [Mixia osmundae IAM 14324]GAA93635.1 hypothetical protein E5Q_00279 [Mixia osmundae IAM 14324]
MCAASTPPRARQARSPTKLLPRQTRRSTVLLPPNDDTPSCVGRYDARLDSRQCTLLFDLLLTCSKLDRPAAASPGGAILDLLSGQGPRLLPKHATGEDRVGRERAKITTVPARPQRGGRSRGVEAIQSILSAKHLLPNFAWRGHHLHRLSACLIVCWRAHADLKATCRAEPVILCFVGRPDDVSRDERPARGQSVSLDSLSRLIPSPPLRDPHILISAAADRNRSGSACSTSSASRDQPWQPQ